MGTPMPITQVISKINIPSTASSGQTDVTDRLALLFEGRTYSRQALEEAASEIDAAMKTDRFCQMCPGLHACVMAAKGWQVFFDGPAADIYKRPMFRWQQCQYWQEAEQKEQERIILMPRFQQRAFETFQVTDENRHAYERCRAYASALGRDTTGGLMLIGPPGVGKTHLAAAIVRVAIERNIPAAFVVVPNLLDEIRRAINGEAGEKVNITRFSTKRLVVLDDLGAERVTDWVREQLYKLVNERYERMLPTIITSNCGLRELEEKLGAPTVDRLAEMCEIVPLEGRSWRRRRGA